MNNRLRPLLWPGAWLMFGVVLAFAPISPYTATLATEVIILTLWAVSYNLVYGYMGEIRSEEHTSELQSLDSIS